MQAILCRNQGRCLPPVLPRSLQTMTVRRLNWWAVLYLLARGHNPIWPAPESQPIKPKSLRSGQIIPVVVSALPREGKPLQVKIKGDISPKDLPPQPQLIHPALDALALAKAAAPDAEVILDDTGERWAQYGCDEALEQACKAILPMPNGAVVHINTPPGVAVIDLDSAGSNLSPFDLSCQLLPVVMRQIRLRRIAGPIVIDFPALRLNSNAKFMI